MSLLLQELRGRSRTPAASSDSSSESTSRWSGSPSDTVILNNKTIHTKLTQSLTYEQVNYIGWIARIDELTMILKNWDDEELSVSSYLMQLKQRDRSPSPAPVYDSEGKRTNTRINRLKASLINEKNKLILTCSKLIPNYKPPADFKRDLRTQEKLFIPVREHPDINFIGSLLGPRGNTLRQMQEKSGARIAIRGKGSTKQGKSTAQPDHQNPDDELHCLIISDSPEKIDKAIKLCQDVINKAINTPVGQNDFKREQLKELAILNGTLRTEEDRICVNCGERGHKRYDCPKLKESRSTANVVRCTICGNIGHIARDCRSQFGNQQRYNNNHADTQLDEMLDEIDNSRKRDRFIEDDHSQDGSKRQRTGGSSGLPSLPTGLPSLPTLPGLPGLPALPGMSHASTPPAALPVPAGITSNRPPPPPGMGVANAALPPPGMANKKPPPPPPAGNRAPPPPPPSSSVRPPPPPAGTRPPPPPSSVKK